MLIMVIENFKHKDPKPIYARFRNQGRLAPSGVEYVDSWVSEDLSRCFQVMRCRDRAHLQGWIDNWSDLVDFEVMPVMTSQEAGARVLADSSDGTATE